MRIPILIITILIISYCESVGQITIQDFSLHGNVKFVQESGKDSLIFNKSGNINRIKRYYESGVAKEEKKYFYDSKNRLEKIETHDYYGKGSISIDEYFYDKNDSVTKRILTENDFKLYVVFKRNSNGLLLQKQQIFDDTIRTTFMYEYSEDLKQIKENCFDHNGDLMYSISKKYKSDLLVSETKKSKGFDNQWQDYHKEFKYDDNLNLVEEKECPDESQQSTNYTLVTNKYGDNNNLLYSKTEPKGASRGILQIREWDANGNLTELNRKFIGSDDEKKYKYEYEFDKKRNWIMKITSLNDNQIIEEKRRIEYYK